MPGPGDPDTRVTVLRYEVRHIDPAGVPYSAVYLLTKECVPAAGLGSIEPDIWTRLDADVDDEITRCAADGSAGPGLDPGAGQGWPNVQASRSV